MKNSLVYLTRACPRACEYCALREGKDVGKELTIGQWVIAFDILKQIGVDFNLILGNETWLLGDALLEIMKPNQIPYALYTTCPEPHFTKYRDRFYESGVIDNLSCGMDYPLLFAEEINDDSYRKSKDAWKGFKWIKEHHPESDTQATITIHKKNYEYVPRLVNELSELGVFVGINFIHWDKGGYDFFPKKKAISDLVFYKEDLPKLRTVLDEVLLNPGLLQNPEFIALPTETLVNMGWHCGGNPYGGPTVDADGTLRCCGYRKGVRTPLFTIFDLLEHEADWKKAVELDALECPGCCWSYPWMFQYWENVDSDLGKSVFVQHGGKHIPKDKWSKRKLQ